MMSGFDETLLRTTMQDVVAEVEDADVVRLCMDFVTRLGATLNAYVPKESEQEVESVTVQREVRRLQTEYEEVLNRVQSLRESVPQRTEEDIEKEMTRLGHCIEQDLPRCDEDVEMEKVVTDAAADRSNELASSLHDLKTKLQETSLLNAKMQTAGRRVSQMVSLLRARQNRPASPRTPRSSSTLPSPQMAHPGRLFETDEMWVDSGLSLGD